MAAAEAGTIHAGGRGASSGPLFCGRRIPLCLAAPTRWLVLSVLIAALTAGCAGTPDRPGGSVSPPATSLPPAGSWLALAALGSARAQLGAPYRYGGTTPGQGFDCSGLVSYSYAQAGVGLPRSARDMYQAAVPLRREALAPGDLVFFRLGRRAWHVGIYEQDGIFIHAPSRGGRVRTERLDDPYWRERYAGAGRVAPP